MRTQIKVIIIIANDNRLCNNSVTAEEKTHVSETQKPLSTERNNKFLYTIRRSRQSNAFAYRAGCICY